MEALPQTIRTSVKESSEVPEQFPKKSEQKEVGVTIRSVLIDSVKKDIKMMSSFEEKKLRRKQLRACFYILLSIFITGNAESHPFFLELFQ